MALITLENAIYTMLSSGTALTALVGGTASPRIYNLQAPASATLPYVVFFLVDGRIPNSSPRQDVDYLYQIEAWAESRALAENIHKAVFDLVDGQSATVTGWSNYDTKCRGILTRLDTVDGRQYWRHAGEYQFKLAKNG